MNMLDAILALKADPVEGVHSFAGHDFLRCVLDTLLDPNSPEGVRNTISPRDMHALSLSAKTWVKDALARFPEAAGAHLGEGATMLTAVPAPNSAPCRPGGLP